MRSYSYKCFVLYFDLEADGSRLVVFQDNMIFEKLTSTPCESGVHNGNCYGNVQVSDFNQVGNPENH